MPFVEAVVSTAIATSKRANAIIALASIASRNTELMVDCVCTYKGIRRMRRRPPFILESSFLPETLIGQHGYPRPSSAKDPTPASAWRRIFPTEADAGEGLGPEGLNRICVPVVSDIANLSFSGSCWHAVCTSAPIPCLPGGMVRISSSDSALTNDTPTPCRCHPDTL